MLLIGLLVPEDDCVLVNVPTKSDHIVDRDEISLDDIVSAALWVVVGNSSTYVAIAALPHINSRQDALCVSPRAICVILDTFVRSCGLDETAWMSSF